MEPIKAAGTEGYLHVYTAPNLGAVVLFKMYEEGSPATKYSIRHHDLKIELLDKPLIFEGKEYSQVYLLLYPDPDKLYEEDCPELLKFKINVEPSGMMQYAHTVDVTAGYHRVKLLSGAFFEDESGRYIDYEYRLGSAKRSNARSIKQSGNEGIV